MTTSAMSGVTITEKMLADAGGWQVLKEARSIVAAGRVREAVYVPPLLSGRVKGAETEFRAGLRIRSRTDIENICTCMESRRWGRICAHSVAVGLSWLSPAAAVPRVEPAISTAVVHPFSQTEGTPCSLHVIFPPNLRQAWEKGSIMVVIEVTWDGGRKPLAALDAQKPWRCDAADIALLEAWMPLTGMKLSTMATLKRDEWLELLRALIDHPRVTPGRGKPLTIASAPIRPALFVARQNDGAVRLQTKAPEKLSALCVGSRLAWAIVGDGLVPVTPGLPAPYLPLLSAPMPVAAEAADGFLTREIPMLARFFEIHGDVTVTPYGSTFEDAMEVRFAVQIEGSLNHLTARLEAVYGERRMILDSTGAALARLAHNRAQEQAALERLRSCGFSGPDAQGMWVLKGERAILAFFATALPRLQREWEVRIGERFEHVTRGIERVEPRVEIVASGEQWFDLRYELESGSGERFSGAEIARMLQSGQQHCKRGTKTVVFDTMLLDEFEHLLRDANPHQMIPGTYRLSRLQAGALGQFSADFAVPVAGSSSWRKWAMLTERLEPQSLGALDTVLRPYQKEGVAWMQRLATHGFAGILADEMGLGKTLQALAFLQSLRGRGPSLIVCPSTLLFNWRAEAQKWTPELRVLSIEGGARECAFAHITNSDLVLTSYPLLRRDGEKYQGIEFAAVILDEAQHIKNPDSQNAQAASALRARHRYALTGTPVENTVRDVWSLMHFLLPGYLGTREEFRERYEKAVQADPSGPEAARLRRRIQPFLLRRTKRTAAADLPGKIEQVSYCELTTAQRELYDKLALAARTQLSELAEEKNTGKARMLMLTALLRLRQAACDARLLATESEIPNEVASAKLDLLEELLAEALDGGHRVLVFSQFVTMLTRIRARLEASGIVCCYLDGQTKDRGGEVARFQQGGAPIFLISLKAGGTGLNLTAADTVIHFDPWWNPAVEAQATDRAHRIGQKRAVTIYKLIARGTIEEKILTLQAKKRAAIEATIENEQPLMEGLEMNEIEELLR